MGHEQLGKKIEKLSFKKKFFGKGERPFIALYHRPPLPSLPTPRSASPFL